MSTLFDRLGGVEAVEKAVDMFYERVLADDSINFFFETTNMKLQRRKQKAFLTMVFGGPNNYTGKNMREAHAPLMEKGLNDNHFDAVVGHLGGVLNELGANESDIAEVANIAESVRDDVLNR